jgi:hypothetical protein
MDWSLKNAARVSAIFILSLPFLALALLWVPLGIVFDIVAFPIWGLLCLIAMLRGDDGGWDIFLVPPLMMLSTYSEITGLIPDPLD